ncbi:DUF4980 domain-containing protein [Parabacteroides sp. Marseille-P3160]|uniref:DUF4980 domain-containing protein n=1 Tax=Parabacteroides sp. Marseille-P3160 TaxID=1917887 RepID=UPI0009BA904F|nr:DUF4980 domain-containing protein [Parabacteroides sp. Marseille-P3160]
MNCNRIYSVFLFFFICFTFNAKEVSVKVSKRYLNLPISQRVDRATMDIKVDGKSERSFAIRLAPDTADYWVFCDLSQWIGKTIQINYEGDNAGMGKIYQSDEIADGKNLYKEANRPQFHFTTRRGWINDPNGLIYYEGEYHLFYQHNPYEREWGNMHWGHAVSKDLIFWKELPIALYPDSLGTMFSGSTVIDYGNTSGFGTKNEPAMVAAYTADGNRRQTQCIAYSTDHGRSWSKYPGNPVIDSKEKWNSTDTRDPKVFWYDKGKHWVLVLNERDGHSIYTSANLKDWTYESHTTGFWECPELFELPVDGDTTKTKWVMYGASGTYMIGSFDGKKFTPETGKFYYTSGSIYAAQTFTNIPASDGRRIQIGWGRIGQKGMPFNNMMLLPTELSLRTTTNGIRLYSTPVKECDLLNETAIRQEGPFSAEQAGELMKPYEHSDYLRIRTTIKLSHATSAGLNLSGQSLINYDLNFNLVNGVFYSPDDITSTEITADIFIDKTSVEVFIDGGAYSYSMERKPDPGNKEGFHFWGNNIQVKSLDVYQLKSIW